MRVRENQLTEMIDKRNREIEELNLLNRRLEQKLREEHIQAKDQEIYTNELLQEIEGQKQAYRDLQEHFDQVNTSRLGHAAISDKSIDGILK